MKNINVCIQVVLRLIRGIQDLSILLAYSQEILKQLSHGQQIQSLALILSLKNEYVIIIRIRAP